MPRVRGKAVDLTVELNASRRFVRFWMAVLVEGWDVGLEARGRVGPRGGHWVNVNGDKESEREGEDGRVKQHVVERGECSQG